MAIRISPDQMRDRASQYRGEADTVNGVIGKMDGLLEALQGEWEGEASKSYAARYTELRKGFVEAENLIREIARSLDTTANNIEQADADSAKQY